MLLTVKNNLSLLTILLKEQVEEIYQATLKILEKIGVLVLSQDETYHPFHIHSAVFHSEFFRNLYNERFKIFITLQQNVTPHTKSSEFDIQSFIRFY